MHCLKRAHPKRTALDQYWPLVEGFVGRGEERAHIVVDSHADISDCHARLTWAPDLGAFCLEDNDSRTGTFLRLCADRDGRRAVELVDGDAFRLSAAVSVQVLCPTRVQGHLEPRHPAAAAVATAAAVVAAEEEEEEEGAGAGEVAVQKGSYPRPRPLVRSATVSRGRRGEGRAAGGLEDEDDVAAAVALRAASASEEEEEEAEGGVGGEKLGAAAARGGRLVVEDFEGSLASDAAMQAAMSGSMPPGVPLPLDAMRTSGARQSMLTARSAAQSAARSVQQGAAAPSADRAEGDKGGSATAEKAAVTDGETPGGSLLVGSALALAGSIVAGSMVLSDTADGATEVTPGMPTLHVDTDRTSVPAALQSPPVLIPPHPPDGIAAGVEASRRLWKEHARERVARRRGQSGHTVRFQPRVAFLGEPLETILEGSTVTDEVGSPVVQRHVAAVQRELFGFRCTLQDGVVVRVTVQREDGAVEESNFTVRSAVTLGSARNNAIHVDAAGVGPVHAQLYFRDGRMFLRDLSEAGGGGTLLYLRRPVELRERDVVLLGSVEFTVIDITDCPSLRARWVAAALRITRLRKSSRFDLVDRHKLSAHFVEMGREEETTIGRDPGCDIIVRDFAMALKHSLLYFDRFEQKYCLESLVLSRKQGTFVLLGRRAQPLGPGA